MTNKPILYPDNWTNPTIPKSQYPATSHTVISQPLLKTLSCQCIGRSIYIKYLNILELVENYNWLSFDRSIYIKYLNILELVENYNELPFFLQGSAHYKFNSIFMSFQQRHIFSTASSIHLCIFIFFQQLGQFISASSYFFNSSVCIFIFFEQLGQFISASSYFFNSSVSPSLHLHIFSTARSVHLCISLMLRTVKSFG